ncbi:hypothetical protein [Kingella negevensis]|nr:hypothetical protein [Kingella negevensis]MDK4683995.1 hypothetical protein [Kingella negevensis]MDK4707095.1 hypothetical protein [Kingella negevensis]MDK4710674.1 hypothetical protein [Kingella negevensis]WII91037.1 hypothetical protein QEO93_00080 [Kingella negevensis]WII93127.1 hypothetical protein QEO94_10995 [Kingella negevensis]
MFYCKRHQGVATGYKLANSDEFVIQAGSQFARKQADYLSNHLKK